MDVWLTYSPRDFLLFSAETYWRLFALANGTAWPYPLIAPALVAALLAGALVAANRRLLLALGPGLAIMWIVVAEAFLRARYEPINWAVAYVWPAFMVEAAVLLLLTVLLARPAPPGRRMIGAAFVVAAIAYPLVGLASGRPLAQSEVVGLAPDPTAIATLGFALLAQGRLVLLATPLPLLWLAASAVTLFTLGVPSAWAPATAAAAGLAVVVWGALRPAAPRSPAP